MNAGRKTVLPRLEDGIAKAVHVVRGERAVAVRERAVEERPVAREMASGAQVSPKPGTEAGLRQSGAPIELLDLADLSVGEVERARTPTVWLPRRSR
jgi:hypothetical protein